MHDDSFTEGARRVLLQASRLAAQEGTDSTRPIHLLWALLLDESQAGETLTRAGLTRSRLQALAPLKTLCDAPSAPDPQHGTVWVQESEEFRRVISHAVLNGSAYGRQSV